jgi:hypothetical protein
MSTLVAILLGGAAMFGLSNLPKNVCKLAALATLSFCIGAALGRMAGHHSHSCPDVYMPVTAMPWNQHNVLCLGEGLSLFAIFIFPWIPLLTKYVEEIANF